MLCCSSLSAVRTLGEVPEGSSSLLTILMHCLLFCCSVCNVWNVVSSQSRSSNDSRHCSLHVHGVRIDSLFSPLFLFQYSLSLVHKTIVLNSSFLALSLFRCLVPLLFHSMGRKNLPHSRSVKLQMTQLPPSLSLSERLEATTLPDSTRP